MKNLFERHRLPKLAQEEVHNPKTPISLKEIAFVVKNLPSSDIPGPNCFPGEFYQIFVIFKNFGVPGWLSR